MTTLHELAPAEPPEPEHPRFSCPSCHYERAKYWQNQSGTFSETYYAYIDANTGHYRDDGSDDDEHDNTEYGEWRCWECDYTLNYANQADARIIDALNNLW